MLPHAYRQGIRFLYSGPAGTFNDDTAQTKCVTARQAPSTIGSATCTACPAARSQARRLLARTVHRVVSPHEGLSRHAVSCSLMLAHRQQRAHHSIRKTSMSDLSRAVAAAGRYAHGAGICERQCRQVSAARLPALAAPRASSPKWEQRRALLARLVATRGRWGSKTAAYARQARPPVRARPAAPPALRASTVELVPHHALRARRAPFRVPPERGVAATV